MSSNLSRPGSASDRASRRLHWQRLRAALPAQTRAQADIALAEQLDERLRARMRLEPARNWVVGVYWPIRSEPALLPLWQRWQNELCTDGRVQLALPEVVGREQALRFLSWNKQTSLRVDEFGACLPNLPAEAVLPDLLIIPCVAFHLLPEGVVRLGYGGGFYDRTLAQRRCLSWGVAYTQLHDEGLQAQPHDCLLDEIVHA
jgi:5-formyltetrahydrofolate cyclo-ligase